MTKNKSLLYCIMILNPYNLGKTDKSVYFAENRMTRCIQRVKNK